LGGLFDDFDAGLGSFGLGLCGGRALGGELLLDLVRVQGARLLAVGFVDLVLGGGGLDAQEVVEGYLGRFVRCEFVAEAEDFAVCLDKGWVSVLLGLFGMGERVGTDLLSTRRPRGE
jgi:hypothetical protein